MTRGGSALSAAVAAAAAAAAVVAFTFGQASAQAATGRADLVLTLSGSPRVADPGQSVTYLATVLNNGPDTASDVRLRDWIPAKAALVSATSTQGSCSAGRPVVCQLGTLGNGASATVTVTVTAERGGWMVDQARVWSDQRDPHPFNNIRVARTFVHPIRADLGVTIAVAPRPAHVGQDVTFTLTVRNHGPASATNVAVRDWRPARTTFVSSSTSQGSCTGAQPVVCSLGILTSGQTATVTVVAAVSQPGVLRDEARVRSDVPDPYRFNNVRFAFVRALT